MSYIIACCHDDCPYAVRADQTSNSFQLVPVVSDVALNRIFSHPYRAGAQQILNWINNNDKNLADKQLSVQDESRFRK
jgi:hypothetical protein